MKPPALRSNRLEFGCCNLYSVLMVIMIFSWIFVCLSLIADFNFDQQEKAFAAMPRRVQDGVLEIVKEEKWDSQKATLMVLIKYKLRKKEIQDELNEVLESGIAVDGIQRFGGVYGNEVYHPQGSPTPQRGQSDGVRPVRERLVGPAHEVALFRDSLLLGSGCSVRAHADRRAGHSSAARARDSGPGPGGRPGVA